MSKTKKREKFFLWLEQYEQFKQLADEKGVSASVLLKEALDNVPMPNDLPKKARNLTIDEQMDEQIQQFADKFFSSSTTGVTGNRSDALHYIIEQYLKQN